MTSVNPLRRPKVPRDQRLLEGTFYFADETGRVGNQVGTTFLLGPEYLWLNSELSIPLTAIRSLELDEHGRFLKRRFLRIGYENPITRRPEMVCIVRSNFFMLPSLKLLMELKARIEEARGSVHPVQHEAVDPADPLACEVCGERPAYYVAYTHVVGALFVTWRAGVARRVHCRRHNFLHGMVRYLITAGTSWFGPWILAYPFTTYATARTMTPSLGRATYFLGVLPTGAAAGFLTWWFVGR